MSGTGQAFGVEDVMVGWQDRRDLETIGQAWVEVELEAGWGTGVRVVQRYVRFSF